MGRYRFEFEYPGIGWHAIGRFNANDLAAAKLAARSVAKAKALDGKPARFTAVRVVDGLIAKTNNPHAAPRNRVLFAVRVEETAQ